MALSKSEKTEILEEFQEWSGGLVPEECDWDEIQTYINMNKYNGSELEVWFEELVDGNDKSSNYVKIAKPGFGFKEDRRYSRIFKEAEVKPKNGGVQFLIDHISEMFDDGYMFDLMKDYAKQNEYDLDEMTEGFDNAMNGGAGAMLQSVIDKLEQA